MRRIGVYIHQKSDWPAFRWDPEVLTGPLAALRHRQGRLAGRMEGLGFGLRAEAALDTMTQDVLKTSEIEGEILDREQVRSSIARQLGLDIGARTPSDRNVEGVVAMMLDATQNYDRPLSEERLFGWHAALFPTGWSDLRRVAAGARRDDRHGPMQVVSGPLGKERVHFEAPEAARVAREVAAFLDWFNRPSAVDLVLKAALAHLWFVTVHPFDDGNGRIARAVGDMVLARAEGTTQRFYSLSAQIRAERNAYYLILERTQRGTLDITPWMLWFLGCLDRAIQGSEGTLERVLAKARFWQCYAGVSFHDRQRRVLNRLLDGFEGKLTSSQWARLAKCSQDTAGRDINDLVARGILVKNPAGGRSTNYTLVIPEE